MNTQIIKRMCLLLGCACSVFLFPSCGSVNGYRKQNCVAVASDLRVHGKASRFYVTSGIWAPVPGTPVEMLTYAGRYKVRYFEWPFGPWHVLNAASGEWTYEE